MMKLKCYGELCLKNNINHDIFDLVTKGKKINNFSFVDSQNPIDKFKKKDIERESIQLL